MKKNIILIMILSLIFIVGCDIKNKSYTQINNLKEKRVVKTTGINKIGQVEENKNNSLNIPEIKDKNILSEYNEFKKIHKNYINIFGENNDNKKLLELNKKLYPYIQKYKNQLDKNEKINQYEEFIIKNYEANGIKIKDINKFREFIKSGEMDKYIYLIEKLNDYLLPDGTIVSKEFKKSFEEFKKQSGISSDQKALEEFRIFWRDYKLQQEGDCDLIMDTIMRADCMSRSRYKK